MSYTNKYLHDVFLSYASVNNTEPSEGYLGLVSAFRKELTDRLRGQGLRDGLDIFIDKREVGDMKPLTDQIVSAARSSAIFVAFHSPGYDASDEWCHREFYEFKEANLDWEERIVLVQLDKDCPPGSGPVFSGLQPRRFTQFFEDNEESWFVFRTDRPGATNPRQMTFAQEVERLARDLKEVLKKSRNDDPNLRVFLTCCSDALRPQAKRITNELSGEGYQVLRTSPWIDGERRRADAEKLIGKADLVIGIEESFRGAEESPAGEHCEEQLVIARLKKKPQLRWLPKDRHGFDQAKVAELKKRSEVVATGLQGFKEVVVAHLRATVAKDTILDPGGPVKGAKKGGKSEVGAGLVLLVCASEDEKHASPSLMKSLDNLKIGYDGCVDLPISEGTTDVEAWGQSITQYIGTLGHSIVLFVDGLCDRDWIDQCLRNFLVLKDDLPSRLRMAVCEFDPIPKTPPRRFRPHGQVVFFEHSDAKALHDFLQP